MIFSFQDLNESLLPLNWKNYILKMAKRESKENKPTAEETNSPKPTSSMTTESTAGPSTPKTPKRNAFEMMMNARSQSIGTNADGKEDLEQCETLTKSADKLKRKQMLEEWAQRKGGLKRKLDEEASEMYIEKQLNKRAKRLKTLISNGKKRNDRKLTEIDVEDASDPECLVVDVMDDPDTKEKPAKKSEKGKRTSKKDADVPTSSKKSKHRFTKSKTKRELNGEKSTDVQVKKADSSKTAKAVQSKLNDEKESKCEKPVDVEVDKNPEKPTKDKSEVVEIIDLEESSDNKSIEIKIKESIECTKKELISEKLADVVETEAKEVVEVKDDDSFLVGLSSPIKKRDSLLGYFDRINKPNKNSKDCVKTPPLTEPATEKNSESKKKKNRKNLKQTKQQKKLTAKTRNTDSSSTPVLNENDAYYREATPPPPSIQLESELTPNGRPKRECRNKLINYSMDTELSPVKIAAKKLLKRARRQLSESPEKRSTNLMAQSPTTSNRQTTNTKNIKLAPIFVKSVPKPAIDRAVLKARQDFLMSGIPDCMKLEMEKQRLFEETYEQQLEYFPSISHVTQSTEETTIPMGNLKFQFNFRNDDNENAVKFERFVCGQKTQKNSLNCMKQPTENALKLAESKKFIKTIKEQDQKFQFYRCFKQLRSKFLADIGRNVDEKVADDDNDLDDSVTFVDDLKCHLNGTKMFTEKYKPANSNEILVNFEPVEHLREFLSNWQNSQNGTRNYDSSDEFDMDGSSSNSRFRAGNFIILIGPHGCGKTNAVYAVANDLQFKVLEINAGCRRSGKKIMRKLQEATQSHQVRNNKNDLKQSKFTDDTVCVISQTSTTDDSQQLSLILIEDADIFFEEDIGFVEAINQLINTSKRPVILSANEENCAHLTKFIQQNVIYFDQPNSVSISKWMSTLAIIEGYYIKMEDCKRLYDFNSMDLRKTLLQLQFFIQSKGDWKRQKNPAGTPYQHTGLLKLFSRDQGDPRNETESDIDFTELRQHCPLENADRTKIEIDQDQQKYLANATAIDRLIFKTERDPLNLCTEIAEEMVRLMTNNTIKTTSYFPIKSTQLTR